MALNLPAYEENRQFDEECMTYIVNLFNPRISDTSSEQLNQLPENCDFLVKGDESVLCYSCNKQSNTPYGESLSQIEFPEPDVYTSVQMKIDEMTNNPYGQRMDELYKCDSCKSTHPEGTVATQVRTLMSINKYIIIQLKTFGFDRYTKRSFKISPNIQIDEQIDNILLGKLNLRAIVYHSGDTPTSGHYVSCVKS